MDSTLITAEVIELIAARTGHLAEVERVTAAAMRGELDFTASLHRRVALLAGVDAAVLDEIGRDLTFTPGAATLVRTLQAHGVRCGIASGGFTQVCAHLVSRLDLDFMAANVLEIAGGVLTGRVLGDVVDAHGKAAALRACAAQYDVDLADAVVIGDGANDVEMARLAGLSVAFNAKPALREHATVALDGLSLEPVLRVLIDAA